MAFEPLQYWLVAVAGLRFLSVVIGYTNADTFKQKVFNSDSGRAQVTALYGRTFAIWTLVTCMLCCITAYDPYVPAIYMATLGSFVIALFHFTTELAVYETMKISGIVMPGIVATGSIVWMSVEWGKYVGQ